MKNVLAIILGGGQGTRLFPLTKFRAKPAVPIGGKFRLIDIPISNCLHWGVRKIYVLTQFNTASLHRHITHTYKFDGFSKGFCQILAAQQTIENKNWYQGTADAVRKNIHFIKNQDVDYVVILSGDQLFRINLMEFYNFHRDSWADITIAAKPIHRDLASSFGILKIDESKRIMDFVEKPSDNRILDGMFTPSNFFGEDVMENFLASMGIYFFNKDVLVKLLEENEKEDFGKQIIPDSIRRCRVHSYIFNDYWEDIGTIGSFFDANLDFAEPLPKFNFYDEEVPIFTHARFLPGSKIKDCHIDHALISDGSILEGSKISHAVVGIRSIIREGSTLERVIMMGADFYTNQKSSRSKLVGIGRNCLIRNAIIDKNVYIGNNVVIDYKGSERQVECKDYCIIDGIVVIPKNGSIPDNTRIE